MSKACLFRSYLTTCYCQLRLRTWYAANLPCESFVLSWTELRNGGPTQNWHTECNVHVLSGLPPCFSIIFWKRNNICDFLIVSLKDEKGDVSFHFYDVRRCSAIKNLRNICKLVYYSQSSWCDFFSCNGGKQETSEGDTCLFDFSCVLESK